MPPINPHQSAWHYYLMISDCLKRFDDWASLHGHEGALSLTIHHVTAHRSAVLNAMQRYHSHHCKHTDEVKTKLDACITQLLLEKNHTPKQLEQAEHLLSQWITDFPKLMLAAQTSLAPWVRGHQCKQRQAHQHDPKGWLSTAKATCTDILKRTAKYPPKQRRVLWFGEDITCIIEAIANLKGDETMEILHEQFAMDPKTSRNDWVLFCSDMITWCQAMLVDYESGSPARKHPIERLKTPSPLIYVFWQHARKLSLHTDDLSKLWVEQHHYHPSMRSIATEQCRNLKHEQVAQAAKLSRRPHNWLRVDIATRLVISKPPYTDTIRFFKDGHRDRSAFDAAITLTAVNQRFPEQPHADYPITHWNSLKPPTLFSANWDRVKDLLAQSPPTSPCKTTPTPPPGDYPSSTRGPRRSLSTSALTDDGTTCPHIKGHG